MDAADFRRIALTLEGAEEGSHMGAVDFRVGGRIFATLASVQQGFGNLMLTPQMQNDFVAELPDVFVPIAGGWGRKGMTHVRLAEVAEDVLEGALRAAWKLRVEKNANAGTRPTSRPSRRRTVKVKAVLLAAALCGAVAHAQQDPMEGLWQGYAGEWGHVSRQLVSLAEAIPAERYSWRPAPGVRSTSEVLMHVALANFWLLSVTGPKMPGELKENSEKTVTAKGDVIAWLRRSLDAVRDTRAGLSPADFQRKVKVAGRDATIDGMYLRIIVHANEHMGQLVAYARMNGIAPPWAETPRK